MPEQNGKLLKVTLTKSPIGYNSRQKETVFEITGFAPDEPERADR